MNFKNYEKVAGQQILETPVTIKMFQAFLIDLEEGYKKRIAELDKRVAELEDLWLLERKPPQKPHVEPEKKPAKQPRKSFPGKEKMTSSQIEECKIKIFENHYALFRLTYPGLKTLLKNVEGLNRYTSRKEGRIWKGINEYWKEYEEWVVKSKPSIEYEGVIKRPQHRTLAA